VTNEAERRLTELLIKFLGVDEASTTTEGVGVGSEGESLFLGELEENRTVGVDLEVELITVGGLEELVFDEGVTVEEVPGFVFGSRVGLNQAVRGENGQTALLDAEEHFDELLEVVRGASTTDQFLGLQEIVIEEVGGGVELVVFVTLEFLVDVRTLDFDDVAIVVLFGVLTDLVEGIDGDKAEEERLGLATEGEDALLVGLDGLFVVPQAEFLHFIGEEIFKQGGSTTGIDLAAGSLSVVEELSDILARFGLVGGGVDSTGDGGEGADVGVLVEDLEGFISVRLQSIGVDGLILGLVFLRHHGVVGGFVSIGHFLDFFF